MLCIYHAYKEACLLRLCLRSCRLYLFLCLFCVRVSFGMNPWYLLSWAFLSRMDFRRYFCADFFSTRSIAGHYDMKYYNIIINNLIVFFNSINIGVNQAGCNVDCKCSLEYFNPICGSDDLTYISPCHAGCTSHKINSNVSLLLSDLHLFTPNRQCATTLF